MHAENQKSQGTSKYVLISFCMDSNMKVIAIVIIILLPIENLYLQFSDVKIRFAEILGVLVFITFFPKYAFEKRILLPPKSKYLIYFFIISSVSLIYSNVGPIKYGIIYQFHQIIQFICIISVYYIFRSLNSQFVFEEVEKKIFYFFDLILLYGLIQVFFYNLLGWDIRFGMDSWRTSIISYRQDIIDPLEDVFTNAPWMRPPSVFAEPVYLGLFCTWIFTISLSQYIKGSLAFVWKYRIVLSMILIVFVASRAAILSISIITLYLFYFSQKSKIKIIITTLIISIFLILLSIFFNINIINGFLKGRFDENATNADPRMLMFAGQITGFLNSPLFGNGRGMTRVLSDKVMPLIFQPDQPTGGWSFWLTLLYDSGIAGFMSLIIYFVSLFGITKLDKHKINKSESHIYFLGLVSIMITGIFFGPLTGGIFWLALLMFYLSSMNNKIINKPKVTRI